MRQVTVLSTYGLWRSLVLQVVINGSEDYIAFIFMADGNAGNYMKHRDNSEEQNPHV